MSEIKTYQVPEAIRKNAHINNEQYLEMYQQSIDHPDTFWAEQAEAFVSWFRPWDKVQSCDFDRDVNIKWFEGARLNVSYNCLDRHL